MNSFRVLIVLLGVILISSLGFAQDSQVYVKTTKESVIRVDSTTGAEVIAKIPSGTTLVKVSQAYDWYKVKLPRNTHAYVFAKYISDKSTCLATKLNIRHKADPASYVLGTVKKDQKVVILDTVGKWYKIRAYPFSYGWIHSKRVETTDAPALAVVSETITKKDDIPEGITVSKKKEPVKVEPKEKKSSVVKVVKKVKKQVKSETVKPVVKKQIQPVKQKKKSIDVSDLDAIINKHKKLKKKINSEVELSVKEVKSTQNESTKDESSAPYSGKLKKARRTSTPARFKLVHEKGYTLLHIAQPKAVKNLINKNVNVWGDEVEEGAYTYVVVKRIKKVE